MKGMVFTEFLSLVEREFGDDMVDDLLESVELASGGAYTSVGTYDHGEMVALVTALSEKTTLPVEPLMHAFADHLMAYFKKSHPAFFAQASDTLHFIESVDQHIHVEVRKLYPDAELPSFSCFRNGDDELQVVYTSTRNFDMLAEGLMKAAAAHFGEDVEVERLQASNDDGSVPFRVRKKAA